MGTNPPMDPETKAANAIVRALDGLPPASQRRVVDWMKDRYSSSVLFDTVNSLIMDEFKEADEAIRAFIPKCPGCQGRGELPVNQDGFKPRCGVCFPFRSYLERKPGTRREASAQFASRQGSE